MTDTRNDEHLQQQAKALFDSSVEQLDAATLSRLNQGRHKALAELHRPGLVAWGRWAPAAGVAAALDDPTPGARVFVPEADAMALAEARGQSLAILGRVEGINYNSGPEPLSMWLLAARDDAVLAPCRID